MNSAEIGHASQADSERLPKEAGVTVAIIQLYEQRKLLLKDAVRERDGINNETMKIGIEYS